MKRKFFLGLFIVCLAVGTTLFCGCSKTKPVILFNKEPINQTTVQAATNQFELGETTHYVLFNPQGFKSPYLRMQIIKKNTQTQNWGFDLYRAQDIKVDDTKKFYIDSVKMSQRGFYIVSFYYLSDIVHPIARATFTVK